MNYILVFTVLTLLGTLSSALCCAMASKKGLDPLLWTILGFLLGPAAILLSLLIPKQTLDAD